MVKQQGQLQALAALGYGTGPVTEAVIRTFQSHNGGLAVDGGVGPDVSGQLAAAGANAFVAGSAVFKGGTEEAYRKNISAIRHAAAEARGEAI